MKPNLEALYIGLESLQGMSYDLRTRAKEIDAKAEDMENQVAALLAKPVTPGAAILVGKGAKLAMVEEIRLELTAYKPEHQKPIRERSVKLAIRFWDEYKKRWGDSVEHIDSTENFMLLDRASVDGLIGLTGDPE